MASPTAAPSGEYAATLYGSSYWANLTVTATSTAASIVDNATNPPNPLLEFQPGFSRSLIIQLIVLAGVATLTFVLLLHLAFTTRYHYPLAKTNYFLLTSGCFLSFCAVIWQISEIAVDAWNRAREWPFMFDYLEFVFPGDSWSASKSAIWLTFNAVVVFLCHVSSRILPRHCRLLLMAATFGFRLPISTFSLYCTHRNWKLGSYYLYYCRLR